MVVEPKLELAKTACKPAYTHTKKIVTDNITKEEM